MIFFDMDGTLIDSNGVWVQVDRDFLGKRGLVATPEYDRVVGHAIFPIAAQFTKDYYHLPDSPEDIMDEWMSLAEQAYAHTISLKEGARELLDHIRAQGRPMALLTSCVPALARLALERLELGQYFQGLFFAQDVNMTKRDRAIYPLAAERLGACVEDCVLLEDAPENCLAAKEAGFTVVGVYDDFYAPRWAEVKANSHRAVRSLRELL